MKVEPVLKGTKGIADYSINLQHPDKLVTISSEGADIDAIVAEFKKAGYIAQKI
jgi:copper chaperone CopZ